MKEEKEEVMERPSKIEPNLPQPAVCMPYLPTLSHLKCSALNEASTKGLFSHFKVSLQSTERQEKKALKRLLSFSKSPTVRTFELVKATPHLCSPRKPMKEVIHEMEKACISETQQQCLISLSVLRKLCQRKCSKCENLVTASDSIWFLFFLFFKTASN